MGDCDMALALNRYLCNAVLPLLTNNSHFFQDADYASHLLDQTLHTAYQLSKCRSLTKNQRDVVSDFLVALTGYADPPLTDTVFQHSGPPFYFCTNFVGQPYCRCRDEIDAGRVACCPW